MGAIRTLKDNGSNYTISSSVDGAVYSLISDDCVISGMGDDFKLTYLSSSLTVTFEKGSQALIGGNAFWLTDSVDVTLPENSTVYLCARIDPTKPNGQTGSFECLTADGMASGNVNSGAKRDLLLYVITTGSSNITGVTDKRNIVGLGGTSTTLEKKVDEVEDKVNQITTITTGTLTAGSTSITLSNSNISDSSVLDFYTSILNVSPLTAVPADGSVTLTFDAQSSDMVVGVIVVGKYK